MIIIFIYFENINNKYVDCWVQVRLKMILGFGSVWFKKSEFDPSLNYTHNVTHIINYSRIVWREVKYYIEDCDDKWKTIRFTIGGAPSHNT